MLKTNPSLVTQVPTRKGDARSPRSQRRPIRNLITQERTASHGTQICQSHQRTSQNFIVSWKSHRQTRNHRNSQRKHGQERTSQAKDPLNFQSTEARHAKCQRKSGPNHEESTRHWKIIIEEGRWTIKHCWKHRPEFRWLTHLIELKFSAWHSACSRQNKAKRGCVSSGFSAKEIQKDGRDSKQNSQTQLLWTHLEGKTERSTR